MSYIAVFPDVFLLTSKINDFHVGGGVYTGQQLHTNKDSVKMRQTEESVLLSSSRLLVLLDHDAQRTTHYTLVSSYLDMRNLKLWYINIAPGQYMFDPKEELMLIAILNFISQSC